MGLLSVLKLTPPRSADGGLGATGQEPDSRSQPPAPPRQGAAAAPAGRPTLAQAPDAWEQTQRDIAAGVEQLKTAIRTEFAEEAPDLIADIDQNLEKLDGILDALDDRLSAALRRAHAAADPAARRNELANAKTILAQYIGYVRSEPLIACIDANPFGVQIALKRTLTDTLTKMAVAIGR